MKARHSTSLVLVWRVAEAEANRMNAPQIEPIHLLIGLAKVVALDLPELVSKDNPDRDEILEELLRETRRLRTVFATAQVKASSLRRKLRGKLPEPRFTIGGAPTLHRSPASKKVFSDAEHFAQLAGRTVYPVHLLYAALLYDDEACNQVIGALRIDKKRFQEVARREVVSHSPDQSVETHTKTKWN
jgi:ATP-dependent Clp protease ATP-binding subunit ClpA